MKISRTIILLACCYCSIICALPTNMINLSGFYGSLETPDQNLPFVTSFSRPFHTVGGYGFRIGMVHFLPNNLLRLDDAWRVGIEADYAQYADNTYGWLENTRDTYSASSLSALATTEYHFFEQWFAVGKLGAARVTQNLNHLGNQSTLSGFAPELAIGVGYAFTKNFQLSFSYDYIPGTAPILESNNSIATVTTYSLTASILF